MMKLCKLDVELCLNSLYGIDSMYYDRHTVKVNDFLALTMKDGKSLAEAMLNKFNIYERKTELDHVSLNETKDIFINKVYNASNLIETDLIKCFFSTSIQPADFVTCL